MDKVLKQCLAVLGSVFLVLLPRASPGVLALAGAYCCARLPPSRDELRRLLFWASVVAAYPALSALWSSDPRRTLSIVASATAIVVVSVLVYRRAGRLKDALWPAMSYGIPAVVIVSLFDVLLDLPVRTALAELGVDWVGQPRMIGKTGHVEQAAANWSITVLALLLFPYLEATREACRGNTGKQLFRFAVVAALVTAVFISPHQSSMLAICVGALIYLIARIDKKIAFSVVAAAWLISICATPLLMRAVLEVPSSVSSSLPNTLRARFLIWELALKDIDERPWIGRGVGSTRAFFRETRMKKEPVRVAKKSRKFVGVAPHSHNWFLDLWRELGAIGAALATGFALLVAQRLYTRLNQTSPDQIAFAALLLSMSTASFSLWAMWYLAAAATAFAMFGLTKTELDEPSATLT